MVTPANKRFAQHVARLLRTSFIDAEVEQGTSHVEGTPLYIGTTTAPNLGSSDVTAAIMQVKRGAEGDTRPTLVVTKENNREPLVHMTLDSFIAMVERCFWAPLENEDIIPITRNEK